jgi:hypothetical protein
VLQRECCGMRWRPRNAAAALWIIAKQAGQGQTGKKNGFRGESGEFVRVGVLWGRG